MSIEASSLIRIAVMAVVVCFAAACAKKEAPIAPASSAARISSTTSAAAATSSTASAVRKPIFEIKVAAGYLAGRNYYYPAAAFTVNNLSKKTINGIAVFKFIFENQKTKTEVKAECTRSGPFIPGYKTATKFCIAPRGVSLYNPPKLKTLIFFQRPNQYSGYQKVNENPDFSYQNLGNYNSSTSQISWSSRDIHFGKWIPVK